MRALVEGMALLWASLVRDVDVDVYLATTQDTMICESRMSKLARLLSRFGVGALGLLVSWWLEYGAFC